MIVMNVVTVMRLGCMATRGTIAKNNVANKIAECFGSDFLGEDGKRYYVQADDGGETIQVAIALTCPKVPFEGTNEKSVNAAPAPIPHEDWNWDDAEPAKPQTPKEDTKEISAQEEENIKRLMERLHLI